VRSSAKPAPQADAPAPQADADGFRVLLVSTYELGHQPLGLASPAAWLADAGAHVTCNDLSIEPLDEAAVRDSDLIAIHLHMHASTRLALAALDRVKALNASAHICFYGLYAPLNEDLLRRRGGHTVLGGEFEEGLVALLRRLAGGDNTEQVEPVISLAKQRFQVPARDGLPALSEYAHLRTADGPRTVGYVEASRGCKHRCRHCPVVPVYDGTFRVVQSDVVLDDIRRQVDGGAEHITFGDPDFFNGVGHALALVEALHATFPRLTYDATIKVEHLLRHARHLRLLADTGCQFVTTAVESVDDRVLGLLDKGHTRDDFADAVVLARDAGLTLSPTFMPFTPWATPDGYLDLLRQIVELDLIAHVAPVQLVIRMLVTYGSRLLELEEVRRMVGEFDADALAYPWAHEDPAVDRLQADLTAVVAEGETAGDSRQTVFARLWHRAHAACGLEAPLLATNDAMVPHLSEPWYCCAEPTAGQLAAI
jgi:radical SAM superfamily enzyme YgiQ (UPF0313 family)